MVQHGWHTLNQSLWVNTHCLVQRVTEYDDGKRGRMSLVTPYQELAKPESKTFIKSHQINTKNYLNLCPYHSGGTKNEG